MRSLAEKNDWDRLYRDKKPYGVSGKDQIARWIVERIPATESGRALEIGCFPGRYLPTIGVLGYELNGLDMQEGIRAMPQWLLDQGFSIGDFAQTDFFKWSSNDQFDLVLSLGFVEHFENWPEVIEGHLKFVAPGGLLLLEAPNFLGGFQNWFHRTFDATNLAMHHVPAMDPFKWADVVRAHGFDIEFVGFFGRFHLWADHQDLSAGKKYALKWLLRSRNLFKHLLPSSSRTFSPYAGMVARKKK